MTQIVASWEILAANSVQVIILHTDVVSTAWSLGLRNLIVPGPPVEVLAGMPYDMARNKGNMIALERGCSHVMHLDSVPGYTPILIKRNGLVECIPICDLVEFSEVGKEYVVPDKEVKIFVGGRLGSWTKVEHVLRHPFEGDLCRINTHSGLVDVSANHSVMKAGGPQRLSVAGEDVKVGMRLSMPRDRGRWGREKKFFFGTPELAWFYGFFAAEGCASGSPSKNSIHVDNNDEAHLERCRKVMLSFFGKDLAIHTSSTSNRKVVTKRIGTSGRMLFEFLRSRFYNSLGQKKVPIEILNAPENIKRQFLQGYYDGDAHVADGRFISFSTNSPTLALGIQWLLQTATRQTYSVQIRPDKLNIVGIVVNQEACLAKRKRGQDKPRNVVKKVCRVPYKGYLYDIETDKHVFAGGVGPILLHNSDVIPPRDAILRLLKHKLPIVSGLYCRRSPPHAVPVMMKPVGKWLTQFRMGSLVEVDVVGAGCLLIETDVLRKMKPIAPGHHWFHWRVDLNGIVPDPLSEDFSFCHHVKRQLGVKTIVDTSVRCRHIGLGEADYGTWQPAQTLSVT